MISERVKASREGLRFSFYIVLGLALAEAVKKTVSIYELSTFRISNLWDFVLIKESITAEILLFIMFFTSLIRYCHGNTLCLVREPTDFRLRVLLTDIFFFIAQSLWFFVMALKLTEVRSFLIAFLGLVFFDFTWVIVKRFFWKDKLPPSTEWIISSIFSILLVSYILIKDLALYYPLTVSYFIGFYGILLFFFDYGFNHAFYTGKWDPGRLCIFVAGPYGDASPPHVIQRNIANAENVGRDILLKGHYPFIPHTMFARWERDPRFKRAEFLDSSDYWLTRCDALFYIGPSPGTDRELSLAKNMGKKIYRDINEIPEGVLWAAEIRPALKQSSLFE